VYFDIIADAMNGKNSDAILIGIGYRDFMMMDSLRNRDYTFPKTSFNNAFPISGGANKFWEFIQGELMFYINNKYRTDTSNQTLMGHSLGGYFVLFALNQALHNNSGIFKNYVSASPSLDYSRRYLIKQFQNISNNCATPMNLLITFGGREDSEEGGTGTEGMDDYNSFVTIISDKRFKNINLKNKVYPSFGHMETAVPTFTKSLQGIK